MTKDKNNNSTKRIIDFMSELKSFEGVENVPTDNPGALLKHFEEHGNTGFMDAANVCGLWTSNKTIAALMQACYPDATPCKFPILDYKSKNGTGSKYSTEYLKIVLSAIKALGYESVRIKTSDDYPLTVEWKFNDGTNLWFILAPRVDND
jgi:hypothetical protein